MLCVSYIPIKAGDGWRKIMVRHAHLKCRFSGPTPVIKKKNYIITTSERNRYKKWIIKIHCDKCNVDPLLGILLRKDDQGRLPGGGDA